MNKRVIVGISGASGVIYGVRLLEILKEISDIETHLIITRAAVQTLKIENDYSLRQVKMLADKIHDERNIAASIASGSYQTLGMIVIPCSIKTLSGIVHSYSDTLLIRAADVVLKERRRLILCIRETPLHIGHLRMMLTATELGAIIMPLVSAFYQCPKTLNELVDQFLSRLLDQFSGDFQQTLCFSWSGRD